MLRDTRIQAAVQDYIKTMISERSTTLMGLCRTNDLRTWAFEGFWNGVRIYFRMAGHLPRPLKH